jgi:hypothetical protein
MPMTAKNNTKKSDQKPQIIAIEVLPAEKTALTTLHTVALARADTVMSSPSGTCRGLIPSQRASHGAVWQNLLTEDQATREQILRIKAKENEVLTLIRDRVAANLMETIDAAIEQGVLAAPEEV